MNEKKNESQEKCMKWKKKECMQMNELWTNTNLNEK